MRRRGIARRSIRRGMRARQRRIRRRTRRLIRGTAMILLVGGTAAVYKLHKNDVEKIEQQTGKSADALTEEELKAAMKKLDIKQLELTDEDELEIERAD
jgi:hypothetical protein